MNNVKLSLSAKVVLLFYFSVVRVALQRRGVAFLLAGAPPSHTPAASDHQLEHTWSPLHLLPHWFNPWTWYMVTLRFLPSELHLFCHPASFISASSLFPPLRILRVSLIRASANAIVSLLHLLSHLPEPELPPSACYETNSNTSLQPSSLSWCLLLSPAYNLPQILTTAMQFEIFL